jgi:hypothetical protein
MSALPAPAALSAASLPGVTGKLGVATRSDGGRQLSVAGHTFVGDSAPSQTNGQGVTLNGGLWTVVSPAAAPLSHPEPPRSRFSPGRTA